MSLAGEEPMPTLRARIRANESLVGTFINLGSPLTAEICGMAGFDWLLIDLEHGSGSQADLLGQLQAISGTGATPLVRVELPARTPASRALDPGAGGIMFPRIESAAQAREAISFMRYPPDGVRGVAGQNRSGRFGGVKMGDIGTLDDDLVGIVQIETLGALDEIEDIAAVDGVDVVFVGPGDLSYALGIPGRLDESAYRDALGRVVAAADRASCAAGVLVPNVAEATKHLDLGFRFIGIGSDSALIMSGATATVIGFRDAMTRIPARATTPA
jgi:4-hydroxy-2-oxoheptanedioate aldolase